MQLILIRHSITAGNLEKRYLGRRTDKSLCPEGVALAQKNAALFRAYQPDILFCSPMKRCTETAEILFSKMQSQLVEDLAECDFGAFEGKNYRELSGVPAYQAWIDSGGQMMVPNGLTVAERCRFRRENRKPPLPHAAVLPCSESCCKTPFKLLQL